MEECRLPLWDLSFLRKLMEDVAGRTHCIPAQRVSCPKPVNVPQAEVKVLSKGPHICDPVLEVRHCLLCKYCRHSWKMKDSSTGSIVSPSEPQVCPGQPGWLSL